MRTEAGRPAVAIRFALPRAELRPFITTFYRTDILKSDREPWLEDRLHPEWANLRFVSRGFADGAIGDEPWRECPSFTVTGPTSCATRFRVRSGRSWGIGLLPLGWAALTRAQASDYSDRFVDGSADRAFSPLHGLATALEYSDGNFNQELDIIETHLSAANWRPPRNAEAISALNSALVDPELATVSDLAAKVEMNVRSLERLSRRAFGFPPKLLLRRQRFLRSLAQFMLDPSLSWLSTLDFQYYDQAHFVRDFRRFMGMSPSEYSKLDKPLLVAAARARMEIAGEAVQGLHTPGDPA